MRDGFKIFLMVGMAKTIIGLRLGVEGCNMCKMPFVIPSAARNLFRQTFSEDTT